MTLHEIVSAISNNVTAGLHGTNANLPYSLEQIEEEVLLERLQIIKEYGLKGILPITEFLMSIDCIPVNCQPMNTCCTLNGMKLNTHLHFEIPQLISDIGQDPILYIGTIDGMRPFKYYTDNSFIYHKHKMIGAQKPYVYINTSPNKNNMYDGYIFNIHTLEMISITGIFKDPRQTINYSCCETEEVNNMTFIEAELIKKVTEKYIRYYRQMTYPPTPNDQTVKP